MSHENLQLALSIHGELCKIVHPATPNSIRYSQIKNNNTLIFIIVAGIISFATFISPLIKSGLPDFVQILGAAGLGITFHSLYTANSYLHNSTFDPRYNQKYIINFALGLLAGVILGLFGNDIFGDANATNTSFNLSANLLALVGGFSAEAVAQILQRIADTLVTLVRGSNKEKNKADADKKVTDKTNKVAGQLTKLLDKKEHEIKSDLESIISGLLDNRINK